jgi:branched-chain amino acid aminotransferase
MAIDAKWIWYDGELVPFDQATTHVLSHTLHYGLGAFEGIRAYPQPDGRPGVWRLEEHLERMFDTLKMLEITHRWTRAQIREACLDVLDANELPEAYIRPLAFLGHGALGLGARSNPVHFVVAAWKWGAYLGDEAVRNGVKVKMSTFTRHHPNAAMQRAKVVGHYVNSIMARYEANADGYDEAIMLDHHGFVAEGTGENVFVVKDGKIKTPPVANILPGITRRSIIELLDREGMSVEESWFGRDAFYVADEAFMVGTAAEVTPIHSVDRKVVGKGEPGVITRRLQELYGAAVRGRLPGFEKLITARR